MSASEDPTVQTAHWPTEHLQGIVERVTYHAEDSGYTVARLKVPSHADLVTIVGRFPSISAGQTLRVTGVFREHPKFGQQFQVLQAQETKPATLTGVEKYLGSGLIRGIGPVTAKRIVAHFGLETLEIIEEHGERLIEVPGIGEKRVGMIKNAWAAQKAIKEVMVATRSPVRTLSKSISSTAIRPSRSSHAIPTNWRPTSTVLVSSPPTPLPAILALPPILMSATRLASSISWVRQQRMDTALCQRRNWWRRPPSV